MMKHKKLAALGLACAMTLSLMACGGKEVAGSNPAASEQPAPEAGEAAASEAGEAPAVVTTELVDDTTGLKIACDPIELSMGCAGNIDGTVGGDAIYKYMDEIQEWTDGNFKINFFPGGKLGGDAELIEGAQMGSVDIFQGAPTAQVTLIPQLAVLDIGGLYSTIDEVNSVLTGEFLAELETYYNAQDLHLLGAFSTGFRVMSANKPINSMADLKGLSIRTQENKYHMEFWKQLGANPTPLATSEVYIALQQNMLEAQENAWISFWATKFDEVQTDAYQSNHIPFILTFVMNNNKYQNMSDTQKQALNQFIYSVKKYIVEGTAADDLRLQKECEERSGLKIHELPEDIKAAYPAAAQAVVDLLKKDLDPDFVDKYLEAVKVATGK